MIVYFADRQLNIIGQASTGLPKGLIVSDDLKTEDIETGIAVFDCKINYEDSTRAKAKELTTPGNYLLRDNGDGCELYSITDREGNTKKKQYYIYAEDDGLDLLNEVVGAFEADKAYPIDYYIKKYAAGAGFEIGINEAKDLSRQLAWDGESTASARIASVATQFDGCEVSYSFAVDGLNVVKKYINIYKERGKDIGTTLRLNFDIDNIITTESVANLATALQCTGGTPDDDNYEDDVEPQPITLKGYNYDDGDFYVDSDGILKSRVALKKWARLLWKTDDAQQAGGHITKQFSYDTISQQELCSRAITELKKYRDMEVNYEVEIKKFPDGVKIGDRVNIVDDQDELYLSARVLKLETSVANNEFKATIGEYLIKSSGISQKVADLAAQFAKTSHSAARALELAKTARDAAESAKAEVDAAVKSVEEAQKAVEEVADVVEEAKQSAANAQADADSAQAIVDSVEERVSGLETTVSNAQAAADNAYTAASTAQAKAEEAADAAAKAKIDADTAKDNASAAVTAANSATEKANTAHNLADIAKTESKSAYDTANAAKADAEQAEKDVESLGERLTTVSNTMEADYARKTDVTETTASLQSQISQNAAQIKLNVSSLTVIDETANNAAEQAAQAQATAEAAQNQADQAAEDAQAAQNAADAAADAASAAQSEADRAKAAADTAKGVADKAEADLEAAKNDLATVSSRVGATEEEIEAAQQAVQTAQAAADKAKGDADAAAKKAADAQSTADTAVENAATAQTKANEAASAANLAQQTADAAKGDAAAAQATADEAASTAAAAQQTANTAKTNAATAQAKADQAAADAAAAQQAADDADSKAAQAASDLATAKQNLANVTSRVDATEEEVAAAQAAVETAQAAADQAAANAATAQSTANTAKANAATAQSAADKAQADATAAQKAADEAQNAADEANKAVGELAVRMTDAETWIEETDNEIGLFAKRTDVEQTLSGYYTKTEADANFRITADSVNSVVSKTYASKDMVDGIEIGGCNLLRDSKGDFISTADSSYGYWNLANTTYSHGIPMTAGQAYTLSFDWSVDWGNLAPMNYVYVSVGCGANAGQFSYDIAQTVSLTSQGQTFGKAILTFTPTETQLDGRPYFSMRPIRVNTENALDGSVWTIKNLKLEKGNKATAWTPALEDVAEDIDFARSCGEDAQGRVTTAESKIQQLADSISMLVRNGDGGSLIRQDSNGLWYFNIGGLEQNVSDAANDLDELSGIVRDAEGNIDVLQSLATALAERTEYVRSYTDENGQPCLELGEGDSTFKVQITNTEIQFMDGTTKPAYISNKKLMIEQAEVKDELQFGGFVWKSRSNGNIGLMWKGVGS